jgi:phosphate/sulfate permease
LIFVREFTARNYEKGGLKSAAVLLVLEDFFLKGYISRSLQPAQGGFDVRVFMARSHTVAPAARSLRNLDFSIISRIVIAWVITFPGAAVIGTCAYLLLSVFL